MPYRLTLLDNLPAQPPNALEVRYTYTDGTPATTWALQPVGPTVNTNVLVANCAGHNLLAPQHVHTRTLVAHYPVAPVTREITISSVQPSMSDEIESEAPMAANYSVTISMP